MHDASQDIPFVVFQCYMFKKKCSIVKDCENHVGITLEHYDSTETHLCTSVIGTILRMKYYKL